MTTTSNLLDGNKDNTKANANNPISPTNTNDARVKSQDIETGNLDPRQSGRLIELSSKDKDSLTAEEARELEDLKHDSKLTQDDHTGYVREGDPTIYVSTGKDEHKEKLVVHEEETAPVNVVTLSAEDFDKRFEAPKRDVETGNPHNSEVQNVATNSETGINPNAAPGNQGK